MPTLKHRREITGSEKFFSIPSGTNPIVKAIAENMKKQNETIKFSDALIKNAGYPRWDKAIIQTTAHENAMRKEGDEESKDTTILFVPFTLGNTTSAVLTVAINLFSTRDTAYNIIYPQHYKQYGFDTTLPRQSWNARHVFNMFATFDKDIFETDSFNVYDGRIFGKDEEDTLGVKLTTTGFGGQGRNGEGMMTDYWIIECHDYLVKVITLAAFRNVRTELIEYFLFTICSQSWVSTGVGGGGSGNGNGGFNAGDPNPFAYPTGGGGGSPGGLIDLPNVPQCPIAARISAEGHNLNLCDPGWIPVPDPLTYPPETIDSMLARYSRAINVTADSIFALSMNSSIKEEWGFPFVQKGNDIYAKRCTTIHETDMVILDRYKDVGEVIMGELHTHPDSSPNPLNRSAPSGDDLETFNINSRLNYTLFVECGNVRYSLVIENVALARAFLANHPTDLLSMTNK